MKNIILLLAFLILTGAGCQGTTPVPTNNNQPSLDENDAGYWKKYSDYNIGFEIIHPYNFEVKEYDTLPKLGMSSGVSFTHTGEGTAIGVWREDYKDDQSCYGTSPVIYMSSSTKFYKTVGDDNIIKYATKKDLYCFKVGWQGGKFVKEGSTDKSIALFTKILNTFFVSPSKFPAYKNDTYKINLEYPPLLVDLNEGSGMNPLVTFTSVKGSGLRGYPALEKPPYVIELSLNKITYSESSATIRMAGKKWMERISNDGYYDVVEITGGLPGYSYTFTVKSKGFKNWTMVPPDEISKGARLVVQGMMMKIKQY